MDTGTSRAHSENGDVVGVSAKLCDVPLNPPQRHHLVLEASISWEHRVPCTQETCKNIICKIIYVVITTNVRITGLQTVEFSPT